MIAVTGATGTQGGALARLLLDRGVPVRALTRNPDSAAARALRDRGADIAYADFDDSASLDAALGGCRAAFLVTTPFGTDTETETRQGIAAVDAAVRVGVDQLVFSSVAHADRFTGVPHFDSKYLIEQHLADTELNWTVLGPGKFMDNYLSAHAVERLRQGILALPLLPDRPVAYICAADIASMAAVALAEPNRLTHRRIDIAGCAPTPLDEAAAFTDVVGHPITFHQVPHEQALNYGADLAAMFAYFREPGLDVDITTLHTEFPEIGWHTFPDWLATRNWSAAQLNPA